jgi:hypothetical protein
MVRGEDETDEIHETWFGGWDQDGLGKGREGGRVPEIFAPKVEDELAQCVLSGAEERP